MNYNAIERIHHTACSSLRLIGIISSLSLVSLFARAETMPKVVRFGAVGSPSLASIGGKPVGAGLLNLAIHKGFFVEEFGPSGPEIQQIFFSGTGPAQNEALAQGGIDFGTYGGVPNVIGLAGGIPAHIVHVSRSTGSGNNNYIGVHPDSPIKTLGDLRGKRITVLKGTNPYQTLVRFLGANGIAENELKLVNLQGTEALVAFQAGAVDAVFRGAELFILRDQGKLRILASTKGFKQEPSASGILVADRFAKSYPETVRRIVKVLVKTAWWCSQEENREELIRFISERSLRAQYIREEYEGSLAERYNPIIDDYVYKAYQNTVGFAVQHRLLRRNVDEAVIRGWFSPEYQQAALKELRLEHYWDAGALGSSVGGSVEPDQSGHNGGPSNAVVVK